MTSLMKKAINVLRQLPESEQEEMAKYILAQTSEPVVLSEAELEAIAAGEADIKAGRFGSDEEFEKTLNRLRTV